MVRKYENAGREIAFLDFPSKLDGRMLSELKQELQSFKVLYAYTVRMDTAYARDKGWEHMLQVPGLRIEVQSPDMDALKEIAEKYHGYITKPGTVDMKPDGPRGINFPKVYLIDGGEHAYASPETLAKFHSVQNLREKIENDGQSIDMLFFGRKGASKIGEELHLDGKLEQRGAILVRSDDGEYDSRELVMMGKTPDPAEYSEPGIITTGLYDKFSAGAEKKLRKKVIHTIHAGHLASFEHLPDWDMILARIAKPNPEGLRSIKPLGFQVTDNRDYWDITLADKLNP